MCTLLEPPPGLVVDFHPTLVWLFVSAVPFMSVSILVFLRIAPPEYPPSMAVGRAWGIALLATLLCLAGASYLVLVAAPTDRALKVWDTQEEAALTPACVSAVLEPAFDQANSEGGGLFVVCFMAPCVAGWLLYAHALHGRGHRLR